MSCSHPDFAAFVEVGRIVEDEGEPTDAYAFAASIRVECVACGGKFGWRGFETGVSSHRPMVSVDALELRVPLISPAELEMLGPLAALSAPGHDGAGFHIRRRA